MTAPERKIPAFFKVYIPELCSLRMQIPSAFTCYMKGKLTDTAAFLRNRRGNVWAVDVTREGRDLYFEKGWVRFIEDNKVEFGDFLVFQFSGDNFYDFKHLGRSCCQKEAVGSFQFTVKPEELGGEIEENEEAEKHDNLWTDEEDEEYDDEEDEEYDDEEDDEKDEAEEYDNGEGEELEGDDEANEDYEEEEEDDDGEEGIAFETSGSRVRKAGSRTNRNKGKAVEEHEAGSRNNANGKGVDDIFKSGLIVQPENAHFVGRLRESNPKLYIPTKLMKKHKLNIPDKITITGEDGKGFVSKTASWGDGGTRATDGWRAFCRWNFVKEDERCLCEFVTHKELMVRIFHFHKGKWMPRPRS